MATTVTVKLSANQFDNVRQCVARDRTAVRREQERLMEEAAPRSPETNTRLSELSRIEFQLEDLERVFS